MSDPKQFGKWKVERELKKNRCFLASSKDGTKGAVKIGAEIENEVSILKKLGKHPNIINLIDHDLEAEIPFMVTEFCEGTDLDKRVLERCNQRERRYFFIQILRGHLHCREKGIAPIAVQYFYKENKTVVLGDFEIAKIGPSTLRVARLFGEIVLLDKIDGEILKDWGFGQRRELFDKMMLGIGYPEGYPAGFLEMAIFFWELMEGKSYQGEINKRSSQERRLEELTQRIEQLEKEKRLILELP